MTVKNSSVSDMTYFMSHFVSYSNRCAQGWQHLRLYAMVMGIIIEQYMALDHILLIIRSKLYSHASCKAGVQSKSTRLFSRVISHTTGNRCMAHWKDLDGEGGRCTAELRERCEHVLDGKSLWKEYSFVPDATVCLSHFISKLTWHLYSFSSHLLISSLAPTSMNLFHLTFFINW